jgi:hypothetical protein
MELIGKPTINPWLFYTGKISGYILWMVSVYDIIEGVQKVLVKLSASFVKLCGIMAIYCYTEFHKADTMLHKVKKRMVSIFF